MRILFVTGRSPWPSRRGDQARTAGLARGLADLGHTVRILALAGPRQAAPPAGISLRTVRPASLPLLGALARLATEPLQVGLHHQTPLIAAVAEEIDSFRPAVAVIVLSRLAFLLPRLPAQLPVVLDLIDSLALNMRARAERQWPLAPLWNWEGRRMGAWDRAAVSRVAVATVVAERDRRALLADGAEADRLHVVPFGLAVPPAISPWNRPPAMLLSGNLGYFPTVEAAGWLAREVWPSLRARHPGLEWWLAGSRPARHIRKLAALPGVRLIVDPPDLEQVRSSAALAVAPLRAGSGTPIKILESMAACLPVVATPEAARGLDGLAGRELAVAKSATDFVEAISRLLGDPQAVAGQVAEAHSWVMRRHDLVGVSEQFEALLTTVR